MNRKTFSGDYVKKMLRRCKDYKKNTLNQNIYLIGELHYDLSNGFYAFDEKEVLLKILHKIFNNIRFNTHEELMETLIEREEKQLYQPIKEIVSKVDNVNEVDEVDEVYELSCEIMYQHRNILQKSLENQINDVMSIVNRISVKQYQYILYRLFPSENFRSYKGLIAILKQKMKLHD
uniref:Uncharacterized protein n=1 Tax=viral metagenome TaxID=1070528 RepID=A0A6C0JPW5_9ZZZZ